MPAEPVAGEFFVANLRSGAPMTRRILESGLILRILGKNQVGADRVFRVS
jgi:hypothetical protein